MPCVAVKRLQSSLCGLQQNQGISGCVPAGLNAVAVSTEMAFPMLRMELSTWTGAVLCCLDLRFPGSPMFDVLKKAMLPPCLFPALCAPDPHWTGTFCNHWITYSCAWRSQRAGGGFGQVPFRALKDFLLDPVRLLNVCFSRSLQDQLKAIALHPLLFHFSYPKVPDSGCFQGRSFAACVCADLCSGGSSWVKSSTPQAERTKH